jgi:hypothetical protein
LYWPLRPGVPPGQPTPKQGPVARNRSQPDREMVDMHRTSTALSLLLIVSSHEVC